MSSPAVTPHDLLLLADQLKLSLLERQRAIVLDLEPNKQDTHISRSFTALKDGLEQLETQADDPDTSDASTSDLSQIRTQYSDLYTQFHGAAPPPPPARPISSSRRNKNVRFRDNPSDDEDSPEYIANRAALFSDQAHYRDDPSPPDHSQQDNQQIHAYHTQTLRDQDEQLDSLGQSIGRQRVLGIQMGNELEEQNVLLEDVERGVDRHATTLERARKRLGTVARKSKGNWSWVTIGILIVILVLLIVVLK